MERLKPITQEQLDAVCAFNKTLMTTFLSDSTELSPTTRKSYESSLRVWFTWIKDYCGNKPHIEIKPLDYKRFQNWIMARGCSSSDSNGKRAAISSLNSFIETYFLDDYPLFRSFITRNIKRPPTVFVNEKKPLTKAEFNNLVEILKKRGEWQKAAYVLFTFDTACRRAESRNLLKNVVDAKPIVKEKDGRVIKIYQTHPIRCKGRGEAGKVRRLMFGETTMEALKWWLSVRGQDDCPYMFITKRGGVKRASRTVFNHWAANDFTEIVGRRFYPHLLRISKATVLSQEDGLDSKKIQKHLGHDNLATTEGYIVRDDSDDLDELFFVP